MKTKTSKFAPMLAIIFISASTLGFGQTKKLPNIVILATGGTIAGAGESATGSSYTSGKVTIDQMVDGVPNLRKMANIKGEQVANVGSQDMNVKVWLDLTKRINELLAGNEC